MLCHFSLIISICIIVYSQKSSFVLKGFMLRPVIILAMYIITMIEVVPERTVYIVRLKKGYFYQPCKLNISSGTFQNKIRIEFFISEFVNLSVWIQHFLDYSIPQKIWLHWTSVSSIFSKSYQWLRSWTRASFRLMLDLITTLTSLFDIFYWQDRPRLCNVGIHLHRFL